MKTPFCLTVSTLFLAATLLPSQAQAPASDAQKQPTNAPLRGKAGIPVTPDMVAQTSRQVVIPELTEVPLILKDAIQATGKQVGSEILFFVARDVYGPGHTLLIARGTPALGQIADAHGSKSSGRTRKLCLRCDYILAQDKTRIPLSGVHQEARNEFQTGDDALVGSLDVGVTVDVFKSGKDVKLPIGKTYNVYVNADTLTAAPTPSVEPDESADAVLQEAFALLKDGNWAIGLVRRVGNTYVFTNSSGSQTVKISDVRSLEYMKDVRIASRGK